MRKTQSDAPTDPTRTDKAVLVVDIATVSLTLAEMEYKPPTKEAVAALWDMLVVNIGHAAEQALKNHAIANLSSETETLKPGEEAWVAQTLAARTKLPPHIAVRFAKMMVLPVLRIVAAIHQSKHIGLDAMSEGTFYKGAHPAPKPAESEVETATANDKKE